MGAVKSKGERLNWPLLENSKQVNNNNVLVSVKGNVLSEDDLKRRRGNNSFNNSLLVP